MFSFGIGGGKSSSGSKSFIDQNQQPYLDFLRNRGQGLASSQMNQIYPFAQQQAGMYGQQGQQFLNTLANNPYNETLQGLTDPNSPVMQAQKDALAADIGNFTREQVLPGIGREAVGVGAYGGTRQGVAEGMAAQGAQRSYQQGVSSLYNQIPQTAIAGAGIASQGAGLGLNALPSMFDMAMAPFASAWQPLMAQNNLVGPPTVLDKSWGSSWNANLQLGGGGR